ncbi:MAG TPA: methyl-accepting chemotaxis protein, partial [Solirubrobacteraceae bacterium]|nr:methyl-accepting chemotaxis protein [Solirubrobacteraceae bacterium]
MAATGLPRRGRRRVRSRGARARRRLAQRSEKIGGTVDTITGIADQTNLLALKRPSRPSAPASRDAARRRRRGGPQARRRVPVGGQDDRPLITEIQGETAHVVEIVEDGAKRTDESARVVVAARDAFIKIGEDVSDMTSRIEQILTATSEVAAVAEQASAATEEVSASTEETTA